MSSTLTVVSGLAGALISLAALALRLYWQAVRDRRRQETLRVLAARLPPTSEVEFEDVRDDGSWLRIRIGAPPIALTEEDDVRP